MNGKISAISILNIGLVLMLCGCYSALHQGHVTDGSNIAVALRPLHHEYRTEGDWVFIFDPIASIAIRYGWAPSQTGELGHSIGITADANPADDDIPVLVRGNYYLQFRKNSFLDAGIGVELGLPSALYMVMSRELGTRFTSYGEVRGGVPGLASLTLGESFDVLEHFSVFSEVSLYIHEGATTPTIGLGINLHR